MMLTKWKWRPRASRLLGDKRGNFAIMTALTLPVGIAAIGVAVDLSNMLSSKSQVQNAADSAALAAASGMANKGLTEAEAILLVEGFIKGQVASDAQNNNSDISTPRTDTVITETTASDGAKSYRVTVRTEYDIKLSSFMSMLNMSSMKIGIGSEAYASQEMKSNPLSMYLVLDKSGSMAYATDTVDPDNPTTTVTYDCSYTQGRKTYKQTCSYERTNYILKIDALKSAVIGLMGQLSTADPNTTYVRTGVATYASSMEKSTSLEWGTSTVRTTTNGLNASGGTNSSAAFQKAVQLVGSATETDLHQAKNKGVPTRYIVFMTDGDNNDKSYDTTTKRYCDEARDAGIEVFTIGFMVNTTRAKDLLQYCATSETHSMSANNAAELNENFKTIGARATAAMTRLTH